MTDRERLESLLTDFGVVFNGRDDQDDRPMVEIETSGLKNVGYPGFVCQFIFDDNGSFLTVGIWE